MTKRTNRPTWYETSDGVIVCQWCRQDLLRDWAPGTVQYATTRYRDNLGDIQDRDELVHISSEEECRRSDFTNIGKTPWKGHDVGDRYMQCDICLQQWGPDA